MSEKRNYVWTGPPPKVMIHWVLAVAIIIWIIMVLTGNAVKV